MRLNVLIALALAALIAAATIWLDQETAPSVETLEPATAFEAAEPLPDLTFTALDGTSLSLADLRGKAVVINFWASWCAPCITEMPQLLDLARAHPDDLVLILMSVDFEQEAIEKFFERYKLTPPVNAVLVWDEGKKISKDVFGTIRYPETILADRHGVMRKKVAGAIDWTAPDIRSDIKALSAD